MRNWPWRFLILSAAGAIVLAAFLVPDPTPQDFSSLSMAELMRLLESPREAVREAASGQLTARAKTVLPDLIAAALQATADRAGTIVAILEELMLSSDRGVAESAEAALEQLVASDHPLVSERAAKVLVRNATLRHSRSLTRIDELGGSVLMASANESLPNSAPDDSAAAMLAGPRIRPTTRIVVLDRNWQGGDAGLKYISRVFPGEPLSLHVADDAPVTAAALLQLRAQREQTVLRRPNQGCLGVSYREDSFDAVINGVVPRSPADRAGLRAGDAVLSVDGEAIEKFPQLIHWTREHHPGEMIELTVRRHRAVVRMRFVLGSDFGTGVCRCQDE